MKEKVISIESGVSLEPLEAKKLADILKSARMLHLGDDMFIDELLEKLKGGNK